MGNEEPQGCDCIRNLDLGLALPCPAGHTFVQHDTSMRTIVCSGATMSAALPDFQVAQHTTHAHLARADSMS